MKQMCRRPFTKLSLQRNRLSPKVIKAFLVEWDEKVGVNLSPEVSAAISAAQAAEAPAPDAAGGKQTTSGEEEADAGSENDSDITADEGEECNFLSLAVRYKCESGQNYDISNFLESKLLRLRDAPGVSLLIEDRQ
eukprot:gene421-349_t